MPPAGVYISCVFLETGAQFLTQSEKDLTVILEAQISPLQFAGESLQ
jgi:hypothetical protein